MNVKSYLFIFTLFILSNCTGKESNAGTEITDNITGFHMVVPSSFTKLDREEKEDQLNKSKKQLNKLHDSEIEFDSNSIGTANIFQHDNNNLFIINTKNFDIKTKAITMKPLMILIGLYTRHRH